MLSHACSCPGTPPRARRRRGASSSSTGAGSTAATIFPQRRIGHLKEGYKASFLVLRGDPLQDFDNVRKIALRVKQGSWSWRPEP